MIDRRSLMLSGGAAAALAGVGLPGLLQPARASDAVLRVASLRFGSFNWLLETIRAEGLAEKRGLNITVVEVATSQAGPVALLSGEAEVIVSDWPWALRQRSLGESLKYAPYSSALGAVMVPHDSPIKTLADFKGKRLGVAGGAIDKSWLLLRAYSEKAIGTDIAELAQPIYGAAPLLTEEARGGRIDGVLNFWTYAAKLEGSNFRTIVGMDDVMKALGIEPVPAMVGFVWKERTEKQKGKEIAAFLAAVIEGNQVLATSDAAWDRIRDLVKPENDKEFNAIKTYYRAGIPGPWTDAETHAAEKLTRILVQIGGPHLLGAGTQFDPKLFHAAGS
jgi:NitT/TauT family transport system substrate-binding protein